MLMRLKRRANGEEGIAMITVVLVTMVMLILLASTVAAAVNGLPLSRRDQDSTGALSAAEAGIDDYVARLNQNDQYYNYGVASTASTAGACYSASDSSTTYTLTMPAPDSNTAFNAWTAISGSNNQWYRYTLDTSCLASQGAIILTVSGRGGAAAAPATPAVVRTLQVTIRRRTFLNYLYFTDYETTDPAMYPTSSNSNSSSWAQTNCALHEYEGRDSTCTDISFAPNDVIAGPLHTNDEIQANCNTTDPGTAFQGKTTTSWNDSAKKFWVGGSSCTGSHAPSFISGSPSYVSPLTLPPTNISLKAQADATLGGTGCLFTGPTAITFNSNGTMDVTSPFTVGGASPNNCTTGAGRPLPTNGVIYVQSVPTSTTDPNYHSGCITATQINGSPTIVNQPLGYPQKYDIDTGSYSCTAGDVFVKGTLNGRVTIAADNNINIINNLNYAAGTNPSGDDILGLVANNYVQIYHPVGLSGTAPSSSCDGSFQSSGGGNGGSHHGGSSSSASYCNLKNYAGAGSSATTGFDNPQVYAAILAVDHSFWVPNYELGPDDNMGSLTVFGAIAQKFRGAVALIGSTGYTKNYQYDTRLKYQSPPYFLDPIASAWQTVLWAEQAPAYSSSAT